MGKIKFGGIKNLGINCPRMSPVAAGLSLVAMQWRDLHRRDLLIFLPRMLASCYTYFKQTITSTRNLSSEAPRTVTCRQGRQGRQCLPCHNLEMFKKQLGIQNYKFNKQLSIHREKMQLHCDSNHFHSQFI